MRYLFIALILSSCGASHHLKQAERHLKKAEQLGAKITPDTVFVNKLVIVPETRFDTVFTQLNFRDTITVEKDNIVTRIKFDTLTKRLYVQTICPPDTVRIEVPVSVVTEISSTSFDKRVLTWIVIALVSFFAGWITRGR